MSDLDYPDTLHYTSDHEWVQEVEGGAIRIGITAYRAGRARRRRLRPAARRR